MQTEADKTAASESPFVIMVKPVSSLCNLRCSYCYYLETARENNILSGTGMTEEILERVISQYIKSSPGPVVSFTWHGGEPVLAGLDFYRTAVRLQSEYLPEGWSCWNSLQTNGTLLDNEWCDFLKENNFDVGLSLDADRWLHDKYRKDAEGHGSFERVLKSAQLLQQHGIQPDLLCTVTSAAAKDPLAVYTALRSLGTGWMQFIPIVRRLPDGRVTEDSVTAEGYGYFLCEIFDEWLLNDIGRTNVQIFAESSLIIQGGSTSLCSMSQVCGRALVVEQNGSVYSCDHFVSPEHCLGNIADISLGQLADSREQQDFGLRKQENINSRCRNCQYLKFCGGGCPKDRFAADSHGEGNLNYLCDGLREFFRHAENPLEQIAAMRRKGMTVKAVTEKFRADTKAKWKGIRRDDPCPCGSGRKAKQCCWHKRI